MSDEQRATDDHDHEVEALVDAAFEDPTEGNRLAAAVAVARLQREVDELRGELSGARAMAWGYEHRLFDRGWVPAAWAPSSPDAEWRLPEWLATSVEPHHQSWWVPPDEESGDEAGENPTGTLVTAEAEPMREQLGHLWRVEDAAVLDVVAGHAERWRTLAWSAREFGADGLTDAAATELALAVSLLLRDRAQRQDRGDAGVDET